MNVANIRCVVRSIQMAGCYALVCSASVLAQEAQGPTEVQAVIREEGSLAALEFEKSRRDPNGSNQSNPIRLDQCENITELTKDLWSKKQVLTDFKKRRTDDEIGVIVIVKTEYCCTGSRLCAVTTACMEKKSTPLVGRFRVYAGWIHNNPDHPSEEWSQWERDVIQEYDFIQGPGARLVVMVPTWDGKMYQWFSNATKLELNEHYFDRREGKTPELESFLQTAIDYAPESTSAPGETTSRASADASSESASERSSEPAE